MADLKTTNIYGDAYINNKVGIATNAPATRLQIGQLLPTAATEGIQFGDDTSTRIYRGGSGQINFNGTINVLGNTYLGDANGDTVYVNDTIRIGATDSGDASLFFGEGSVAGSDYGAKWYWDSGYTFTWYTRNNGTDTALFDYVTNDTTYLNWRRHFHMQNKEINYNAQIHFNAGTRFVGQDTNYLVFRSDSTSVGGIRVQDGGIATKGYIGYWDSSGGGILNNTGEWALRYNFGSANSGGTLFGAWTVNGNISAANLSGTNTGDQSIGNGTITIAASTGVSVGATNTFTTNQSGATTVTITNTGVTSALAGTGVGVSGATGAVTFSIGQAVGTSNSPTFAGLTLSPSATSQFQLNSPSATQGLWIRAGYDTDGTATPVASANNIEIQSSGASSGTFSFVCGNTKILTIAPGAVNSLVALQQSGNQVLHAGNVATYALPIGGGTLTGGLSGTTGFFSGDLSIVGQHQIRNANPTITFRDTNNRTAYIHVNGDIFYVLTAVADSAYGSWTQVANSRWPLELNLSTNNAVFGADVNAISFTGAGTGLTGTAASLTAGAVTNGVYTNTNNSLTAITTINNTSNTVINNQSSNLGLTMLQATTGTDAYMTFHIVGDFAAYFGLGGAENDLVYGGWSVGNVRHRILHSGNAPYAWNMNQYVRTTDSPTFVTVTAALTGNATTSTTLQTARNINGTSFNGSADITTANWGTARTLTIGSTGKSVDGSAAITWSLAEIGAAATNQTMFVGTTSVAINRASAAQTLTGVNIDGYANYISAQTNPIGAFNVGLTRPKGASYTTTASSVTGAIKIKMPPGTPVHGMWKMTIKIYEYGARGNGYTIECGCHLYPSTAYNRYQYAIGVDANIALTIRYGTDGTSGCIWIGENATTWSYPQIHVTEFSNGFNNPGNPDWNAGTWGVTIGTIDNSVAVDGPYTIGLPLASSATSATTAGSISGFNNPATAATANTIVYRDGSGHITGNYIFGSYLNSTDDVSTGTITNIVAKFGDNYHRSATAAKVATFISGQTMSIVGSSTSCTGNAATATALSSMNISQFTNNSGYLTSVTNISGNAATATLATKASTLSQGGGTGTGMTFNWSGQGGQPTWLWGSNDGSNIYVWNPSNFNVNYATSAGSATSAGTATSAGSATTAGSCSGNAATATNVAASGITGQTGMWTSATRPGPYRLYRNDDDSAYNVQLTWQAHRTSYWSLRGFLNDGFHAECFVVYSGYADSAGSAGALTTGNTYQVASLGIGVAASNKLHINGDGSNPTIRIDNTAFGSGTSSSRGFFGWLPISINGNTRYIQLYS